MEERILSSAQLQPFQEKTSEDWERESVKREFSHYQRLFHLRESDINWKLKRRPLFGWILLTLLLIQNVVVFGLAIYAYFAGNLKDLQIVLAAIVTGTLAETAFAVRIIVQWLFSDIDYGKKK